MKKALHLFLVLFIASPGLFAQRTAASLSGTVTDPSGAVVPGATVTVINSSTGATATAKSNASGFYIMPNLDPGTYRLRVENTGFQRYIQNGILLQVNRATNVNARLKLGSSTQTVTITGQGSQVNVRSGTQAYEISAQMATELPLNGRNVQQLMLLAPDATQGNSTYFAQGATRPDSEVFVSASGGQGNTTTFYLDGGLDLDPYTNVANILPNPDAIQEFSYQTNSFNAKFAGAGGGVMNVVTKSGTNRLHGTLFDFIRNGALFDARNFFAPTTDLLKWNQFGGSVGGPIRKNNTFFFVSYEGLRERVAPSGQFAPTPTQAERNGDWSAFKTQLVSPFTGVPFPNNQVNPNLYNSATQKLTSFLPVASSSTGLAEYSTRSEQNENQFITRIDHNFGSKFSLYGTYLYDQLREPSTQIDTDILTASTNRLWRSQHSTLNGTYTLRPTLLANFTVSYDRETAFNTGAPHFPDWPQLGVNLHPMATSGSKTSLGLSVSGYFSALWDALYRVPRQNFDYASNWTWITGNHTLEFGGEFARNASTLDQDFLSNGYFAFGGALSGNNLLDFMMGDPSLFEQFSPIYASYRRNQPALYMNDTWKMRRRLTWSLGVRWSPWLPLKDVAYHQMEVFSPDAFAQGVRSSVYPTLPPGYLIPGDPGIPVGGIPDAFHVFDPRIGVAYDVFGNGSTSIRAGYGMYHDQVMAVDYNNEADFPPFVVGVTREFFPNLLDPYQGITDPFPVPRPTPKNFTFPEPFSASPFYIENTYPTTQQWNVSFERQLPAQTLLRIAYEGSNSYHMFGGIEANAAVYNPNLSFTQNELTTTARRPMGQYFTSLPVEKTIGTSNFNALVVSIEKRMSHGLTFLGGYRWSKCMDEVSASDLSHDDYTSPNPSHDYGPCDFNVTNQFQGSFTYQLPTMSNLGVAGREIFGGWMVNGILTFRSGLPFSVSSGKDLSASGIGRDRADAVGNSNLPGGRSTAQQIFEWFNTQAFALNAPGTYGNAGRNSLNGPSYSDIDFSLIKSFRIPKFGEASRLNFRADFFNGFNFVNLNNPGATLSTASTFGRITSAGSPRIIQLALKYYF